VREQYLREMKAVISQGMGLTNELAGTDVTWGTPPTTPAPVTAPGGAATVPGTQTPASLGKLAAAKAAA
jgi:hypothetical protein